MAIRKHAETDAPAWWVRLKDVESGPYDVEGLARLRSFGRLGSDTPARRGSGPWKPFRDHPVARALLEPPPRHPCPRSESPEIRYAGAGARMRASTIDGLAVSALVWILSAFLPDAGLVGSALLGLAVSALYGIVPVCGPWRATPGKRIAGIMVERMDGDALGPPLAAGRWAAGWLSWLPFCLGYLPILAGADKATLHDSMCGTRVVAGRAEDVS